MKFELLNLITIFRIYNIRFPFQKSTYSSYIPWFLLHLYFSIIFRQNLFSKNIHTFAYLIWMLWPREILNNDKHRRACIQISLCTTWQPQTKNLNKKERRHNQKSKNHLSIRSFLPGTSQFTTDRQNNRGHKTLTKGILMLIPKTGERYHPYPIQEMDVLIFFFSECCFPFHFSKNKSQ